MLTGLTHSPSTIALTQDDWEWSVIDVMLAESTQESLYTSIASDPFGNTHVVWADATNYTNSGTDLDIFYKYWDSASQTWGETEVISVESTSTSNHPDIVSDPFGNMHVTWYDYTDYDGAGTDADIFYKKLDLETELWSSIEVI